MMTDAASKHARYFIKAEKRWSAWMDAATCQKLEDQQNYGTKKTGIFSAAAARRLDLMPKKH